MKFINLLASLCFSMETVHKVPPPPTEKHQERQSAQSQAPQHTSHLQVEGYRSGAWSHWPPRAWEYCVYFASLISLSCFWLIEFPHKTHIEKFGDVIDGSRTRRRRCMVLRCLAESWTTNPGLLLQPYQVHACTDVFAFVSFVPLTFSPLFASWICTFMEYDTFYKVLSHALLQCSSKVMFIYLSIDEETETQKGSASYPWCLTSLRLVQSLQPSLFTTTNDAWSCCHRCSPQLWRAFMEMCLDDRSLRVNLTLRVGKAMFFVLWIDTFCWLGF